MAIQESFPRVARRRTPVTAQQASVQPGALRTRLAGPLPRAGFGQRLVAFAIDLGIILVVELVISVVFGGAIAVVVGVSSGAGGAVAALLGSISFLLSVAIPIAYFGYLEGQARGQTCGKRALGIRVVDFSTAVPISMSRAMIRSLVRAFLSGILLLGYLWMLWDPQEQTWHDKLASTAVVPESAYPT
jgi:uncharacterized RDD family membrane protein YckC